MVGREAGERCLWGLGEGCVNRKAEELVGR